MFPPYLPTQFVSTAVSFPSSSPSRRDGASRSPAASPARLRWPCSEPGAALLAGAPCCGPADGCGSLRRTTSPRRSSAGERKPSRAPAAPSTSSECERVRGATAGSCRVGQNPPNEVCCAAGRAGERRRGPAFGSLVRGTGRRWPGPGKERIGAAACAGAAPRVELRGRPCAEMGTVPYVQTAAVPAANAPCTFRGQTRPYPAAPCISQYYPAHPSSAPHSVATAAHRHRECGLLLKMECSLEWGLQAGGWIHSPSLRLWVLSPALGVAASPAPVQ